MVSSKLLWLKRMAMKSCCLSCETHGEALNGKVTGEMNLTYGLLSSKSKLALRKELLMMELFGSVWMTLSNISAGFKFARFKMITFSGPKNMMLTLKFGNLVLKNQVHTPFQSPRKERECSQRMQVMNTATLE
jgi:hypothetical protein